MKSWITKLLLLVGLIYLSTRLAQARSVIQTTRQPRSLEDVLKYWRKRNDIPEPALTCESEKCTCLDGQTISEAWVCDGDSDCADGEDESGCSRLNECQDEEFACKDGTCVSLSWVCDGEPDCPDSTDESKC